MRVEIQVDRELVPLVPSDRARECVVARERRPARGRPGSAHGPLGVQGTVLAGLLGSLCVAVPTAESPVPQPPENQPPVFGEGTSTTRRLAENPDADQDIPPPITADDGDGHRLTYRLGGDDADFFALHPGNGRLRTRSGITYDHEVRDRYAVTIEAHDGHGTSASIAVTVEVTDELEPPSAPDAPSVAATARDTLTVRWTAPANTGPGITDYAGRYRAAGSGAFERGWERVGTATQATIGGLTGDTLYEVQVRATNAEGVGGWSESMEARTAANRVPVFGEGAAPTRELVENAEAYVNVGAPVTATDADDDRLVYSLDRPDASSFTIDSASSQLRTRPGATYDYETQPEHTVTVRVEDGHGGSATAAVTVALADVDDSVVADAGWDLTVAAGGTAWLDGTASRSDEGELTYSWSLLSWPGDSAPALNDATGSTPSFAAAAEGTYVVRLTVGTGSKSATDDVEVTARPATESTLLLTADLLVDTNRDGLVDASDEAGEDAWDEASGAVFGSNADDDDGDGVQDGWDDRANGDADLLDMAPVVVRQIPGLHRNHSVTVELAYTSTWVNPQLFYQRLGGGVELLIGASERRAELPLDQLVAGDLHLYIDSALGRYIDFDGQLSLTLTVQDAGVTMSRDSVALRGGPILFSHHLQPAERVFIYETPAGYSGSNTALVGALNAHLPASTDLYRIADGDRWVQDFMQTGYVQRPGAGGTETVALHTQLHRGRDLRYFLGYEYLSSEAGYVYPGGEYYSTLNYGGNVEVIPPHEHGGRTYPFGRIVIGGGYTAMAQRQIDFFNAQGVQGPPIVVDTSWLWVAHVDEIFSVIPNHEAAAGDRPWVVAIASPALAVDLLEEAVEEGFGDAPVFDGRYEDETTAKEMLADSRLMTANDHAQRKIDTVRDELKAEVGLADSDFREVPALFDDYLGLGFYSDLVALAPSIQNLLVIDDVLFVPDPEGPDVDGVDIWQQATLDAVKGLGLTTHFVDVYYSYHVLSGAIHCGTNVEHAGSTTPWWLNVDTEDSQ